MKCDACSGTGRRAATAIDRVAEFSRIRAVLGTACGRDATLRAVVDITLGNIRTAWEHDDLVARVKTLTRELKAARAKDRKRK